MPRLVILAVVVAVLAGLAALYLSGADRAVQAWALEGQRETQNAMAGALRALRAGDLAAVGPLLAICFGYGFFHAAGPGHGKLLIGAYGAAAEVGAVKLSLVALASSLAQGLAAVALVGAGVAIWGWSRTRMTDLADDLFAPLSFGAIALIGVWLVLRGLGGMWRLRGQPAAGHDHGNDHDHDHAHHGPDRTCATCGHAHAPDPAAIARARDWRDIAALIGAVAIRPCTGALFLLILTAQMGVFWVGVLGTVAMALGTASVTVAVAVSAVGLRRGMLAGLSGNATLARVQPMLEIGIGLVVAVVAGQFALRLI
ncbi:MAG: hypothetical protein NXH79_08915 [Rhodobacteraceae bacterium]|nr:hypothetical protein [Paracoccaceae bacterium]